MRELPIHNSELMREAADGAVVVASPNFEIEGRVRLPDLSDLWSRFPAVPGDSGRFLEEGR